MSLFARVILRTSSINIKNNILSGISSKFHTCQHNFAGHSKWANIKHIKALKDGQRAAIFIKLCRQIRLAIQEGGSSNPVVNTALKNAIDQALRQNMPMSTIQGAIKKYEQNKGQLKKYILELRAFNKIYMVCILYTDNFSGSKMTLTPVIRKFGAVFTDAVHLFEDTGLVEVKVGDTIDGKPKSVGELEELCTVAAIESGAEDVEVVDFDKGVINFYCNPIDIDRISGELTGKGYRVESAAHLFIPKMYATIPEKDLKAYEILLNKLKEFEGIEEVYDNLEPAEN